MSLFYLWTIGCQMNQAESNRLANALLELGFVRTLKAADADIILLNSCVVRQHAEDRVVNKLANMKPLKQNHPEKIIILAGCLVDNDTTSLKEKFPYVDLFLKPGEIPACFTCHDSKNILPQLAQVSSYVPIIYGCNNFCSYCIVPYRRGREHSRPLDEVRCEVEELVRRGSREIILLGQNVDSYGHDLAGKPDLADLLTELSSIDGLWRIRFLTNHPKDMNLKLIHTVANLDKICEEINLPIQAGNDKILRAMKRGYTTADYLKLVAEIRELIPSAAISSDLIVAFPGESEADFQDSCRVLREVRFDTVHVAAYSTRSGTVAARELTDNVSAAVKKERLAKIEEIQEEIATTINAGLMGKTVEILITGKKKGNWQGRTRSGKLVFCKSRDNCYGKLVKVEITHTSPWSLSGNLVTKTTK